MGLDVHLIGICGTGMGSFAGLLGAAGHRVRGSDQNVYPPMSKKLEDWGVPVFEGYRAENLHPPPDLVVVGNAIRRDNPEAMAAERAGLTMTSFPAALRELFLDGRRSLVVAGTHGKTTTTSLLAWMLARAGRDPSFLIGGVPENFGEGFRWGKGPCFVVEGDEYDTAYFDKRPKFLHYQPERLVITSLEYDHADIYPDVETIEARFEELVALVPDHGLVLACASAPRALARRSACRARFATYTARDRVDASWRAAGVTPDGDGVRFTLEHQGRPLASLFLPMSGRHNVENAVAASALALEEGLDLGELAEAMASFRGVARRQTVRAVVGGVRIIDDFAHHPSAVAETLAGLCARYPEGRLVAVFEPRTATSARSTFHDAYARAFADADLAVIAPVGRPELPASERLDVARLVLDIEKSGTEAEAPESLDRLVARLTAALLPGDTVVLMSNGGFGGVPNRLETALAARFQSKPPLR